MSDVMHPSHYQKVAGVLEPIDFCRLFPFAFGNVCKYLLRAGHKDSELSDLCKAYRYLQWAYEDLWQYEGDLRRYSHLAKCFHNKLLDLLFQGDNFAANFELTSAVLKAYIELKGGAV